MSCAPYSKLVQHKLRGQMMDPTFLSERTWSSLIFLACNMRQFRLPWHCKLFELFLSLLLALSLSLSLSLFLNPLSPPALSVLATWLLLHLPGSKWLRSATTATNLPTSRSSTKGICWFRMGFGASPTKGTNLKEDMNIPWCFQES